MGLDFSLSSIRLPESPGTQIDLPSRHVRLASRIWRSGVVVESADVHPDVRQKGSDSQSSGYRSRTAASCT